ncbi:uncharacterized protein MONOS_15300 [Monocercomonoides exilis]|uniref:uncharacterized protein n=1 Tax=Monocercomonoides exilis TaxID=2049356 RepID=UPI00355A4240|nr:hypothetical protein MONOS_15300 [Monocercomonoides exilis]|eukprot:MONOS_15300.1-p1 / transcript=MONOS_15300.1 / gene=MONOS_15300 / organism=Monocercomonoides_exilis_PA203 / gene_product=unspecified product / transcript_product=unspecified product / location=Mono_scaffold01193:6826-8044(-) / protein_length=346 / sequence_SO=supercontig / SO=protein_coding / is_pseudo=false
MRRIWRRGKEKEGKKQGMREERVKRTREMIKMRKVLKPANEGDSSDEEKENKVKEEENESLSLIRRNSLQEMKKKEESECLSDSSIIGDEEERREKRHKQREKQKLMRRYYQALELQRDSVVNEVLLMVRPNLLLSPAPIDESIKRPGMSVNAAKSEGNGKEDGKEEKEVNNSVNANGNKEEVEGNADEGKDENQKVILEDSMNNLKEVYISERGAFRKIHLTRGKRIDGGWRGVGGCALIVHSQEMEMGRGAVGAPLTPLSHAVGGGGGGIGIGIGIGGGGGGVTLGVMGMKDLNKEVTRAMQDEFQNEKGKVDDEEAKITFSSLESDDQRDKLLRLMKLQEIQ